MQTAHLKFTAIIACLLASLAQTPLGAADAPYRFLREIPVGGDGGWDYLSIDAAARQLYVTHAGKIVVVDIEKNALAGEIADTPGVHGFALAPELGRGFSSNGRESQAGIVDLKTLRTLAKVPTGENPDAILYESGRHEVYAFNGRSRSATVFDAMSGQVTNTIALPGQPEFAAADPELHRVYCNIEDRNAVVAIDTRTHQIVNTWPTAPGEEPAGLAIDRAQHRLFIGCHNQLMVMMDSTNGNILSTAPIASGVDANAFDPATRLAFSSCGAGSVTIAREETPGKLAVVQVLATERGARTMALDPKTHRIYLATARFEAQPAPAAGTPPPRPKIIPGSLKLLVYGMEPPAGP